MTKAKVPLKDCLKKFRVAKMRPSLQVACIQPRTLESTRDSIAETGVAQVLLSLQKYHEELRVRMFFVVRGVTYKVK